MSEAEPVAVTVPLNEQVWQAWVEKNRRVERAFHAKVLRFGGVVGVSLLAVLLFFLARSW